MVVYLMLNDSQDGSDHDDLYESHKEWTNDIWNSYLFHQTILWVEITMDDVGRMKICLKHQVNNQITKHLTISMP